MKKRIFSVLLPLGALALPVVTPAHAGTATWSGQLNGNWNVSENWSPQTVPNSVGDIATMGSAFNRTVYLSASTNVGSITFPRPVSPLIAVNYSITVGAYFVLTIGGTGITNSSGQAQNVVILGAIDFENSATAGGATFTINGNTQAGSYGGAITFTDHSTAGNGVFTNNGSPVDANGQKGGYITFAGVASASNGTFTNTGTIYFNDFATADAGTFANNGNIYFLNPSGDLDAPSAGAGTFTNNGNIDFYNASTADAGTFTNNGGPVAGSVFFNDTSTAADATFTNHGSSLSGGVGGQVLFGSNATAASATFICNGGANGGAGGLIGFSSDSDGGFASVKVFGNGSLDISQHNSPGVNIGSIQGSGRIFLGANNLTVGLNNLSTAFSGVIADGGAFAGTGGSLTKLGNGKLTLSHANTYTGGTTLNGGMLLVQNKTGSGTASGVVQVNKGTLGGTGSISNAVTVGNGSLAGAILLAGTGPKAPGILTINNPLTLNPLSSFECGLKRTISSTGQVTGVAGKVTALGVTINSNVPFTLVDSGTGILPIGTVFTVINNTSASPIAGRFSNLAAGSTFISNGNTFKVSYTGGTGNDLTLQVVH